MLFGPYGHGKSTYLKHLTGNQAFICGNNEKTTTLGIYIDGKYTVDDIKNQVSEMIAPDYLELFDSLNLDDNYHIYFLDSQGIGDDKYLNQKDILDRINSIFCSSSSACISIQSSNEDGSLKSVFQISRSIQFSSLTKQFFLVRNYNVFNSLTDLSYESLNDFQQNDMENYKKERKSILELYDVKNIMLMGFGDMANMDSFYISIWFSFYTVLSNLKDEIIYSSSEIKNKLKSKAKMFFGEEFKQYEEFIKNPPTEFEPILPKSSEPVKDINRICILSFYWSLDKIINYLYSSEHGNLDKRCEHVTMFIENIFKLFFPYMLSQNENSYINYVQNIKEITHDLISSTICEIQNVQRNEKYGPYAFIFASGSMIFSCSEVGSISLTSGVFLAFTYIIQSVLYRKISFQELLNRFHYTNYPLIWNNMLKNITMSNLPFSKRPLINDEINFNKSFNTNKNKSNNTNKKKSNDANNDESNNTDNDESNNTDNDEANNTDNDEANNTDNDEANNTDNDEANNIDNNESNSTDNDESNNINNVIEYNNYDELYDGDSLREIYANRKCKKQIPKIIIENECIHFLSALDNYQLIVFFEQNITNDSSLLFKALSGIDSNFTNHKQMKISSDSINIDILMERFRGNNGKPYSTIKNAKIKFIYPLRTFKK